LKTGKIKLYEQLKKSVPIELMDLMEIKGFGPQSLKQIHKQLKISTKDELFKALEDGTITKLKGFGQKKAANMLEGIKLHKTIEERMLLWDALEAGENIVQWMKKIPEVIHVELAGSLRRGKETIGDIDILASGDENNRKKIVDHFTSKEIAKQILAQGDTKASIVLKNSGRQADLRIVNEDEWGSALQYFTGSKEHNIHLRTIAKEQGFKISEYGIFSIKSNKKIAGKTEEEIYRTLGFQMMPPEMREDIGEIKLASKNKIPKLVSLKDIKGDLHIHSTWSDGLNTIEEIVNHVRKFFSYQYIVITDHSKSSRIAKGLDEKQILKQVKEIEELNEKLGENFVKTGLEVDILPDGKLDISDEILSRLNWVSASIHSNFNQDNTDRIIRACENPCVNCISHPTGRLIGVREPYLINIEQIIETAKHSNTALEINSQPNRMDLNDELSALVREEEVKIVINTDSHSLDNFNFMKLGVIIARRAWCTPANILNTKSWGEIERFKKNKIELTESVT
jgi:DNA polymerase (family 10)